MALALEGTPVHNNATSGSSLTTGAFTTTQAAEIFISVTINGTSVSSISGGSLTWSLRKRQSDPTTVNFIEEWAAQASGALSSVQFTLTLGGSTSFITTDVYAFSGQDTSTIWDGDAGIPYSAQSDPITFSTSNANDSVIASYRMGSTASPTQGNIGGSAATKISGADFQLTEYRIVSTTQSSQTATIGTGAGNANAGIVDAIMQASGGGGGSTSAGVLKVPGNIHGDLGLLGGYMQ